MPEKNEIWSDIKEELKESFQVLFEFLKDPLTGICQVPDWDWRKVLLLQAGLAAICGFLSGILTGSFLDIISRPILLPLVSILISASVAGALFYYCSWYLNREVSLKRIYTLFVFASVPGTLLLIIDPILPLVFIFSTGATVYLLIRGLNRRLTIPEKPIKTILWVLYGLFFVVSLYYSFKLTRNQVELNIKAEPKNIEIIEREMRGN